MITDSDDFTSLVVVLVGVLPEHQDYMMQWIEGWWVSEAIRHLKRRDPAYISALDVHRRIADQNSLMPRGYLLHNFRKADPAETPLENTPLYIRQLIRIGATQSLINNAKLDYIRAYKERSCWVHHKLIFPEDDKAYDDKLVEEWENLLGFIESEFSVEYGMPIADADEKTCQKFGLRLYREVCELDLKLKIFSVERYVVRGSYHMLADMNPPLIGWHPNFKTILEELLISALRAA